jgi:hypothetical protein
MDAWWMHRTARKTRNGLIRSTICPGPLATAAHLVEPARLSIPLLDRVECRLARKIEHEEDGNGVVADQGQHVDKLALPCARVSSATRVDGGDTDLLDPIWKM